MTLFVLEHIHPQEGAAGPVRGLSHYSSSICSVPTMPVSHEGDMPLFPCDHSGNSSNSIALLWLCFVTDNHSLCGRSANGDGHEAGEKHVWKAILLLHLNAEPQSNIKCSERCELEKKCDRMKNLGNTLYTSVTNHLHNTTILTKQMTLLLNLAFDHSLSNIMLDRQYNIKVDQMLLTHVFRVPDVMSSVTNTIHLRPLQGDSHES